MHGTLTVSGSGKLANTGNVDNSGTYNSSLQERYYLIHSQDLVQLKLQVRLH